MRRFNALSNLFILLVSTNSYLHGQAISRYKINPSGFLENKGQITDQNYNYNPAVKYLLCRPGFNIQLRQTGFSYDTYTDSITRDQVHLISHKLVSLNGKARSLKSCVRHFHRVDVELQGCNMNTQLIAEEKSSSYFNYFTAGTPLQGISNVHYYQKVTYKNIYPNIDLEFLISGEKHKSIPVEYRFIVHKGGDPKDIKLQYKGAKKISLIENKIILNIAGGYFTESIPSSYTMPDKREVKVDYISIGKNVFAFSLADNIKLTSDLVIDPVPELKWGTYYGECGMPGDESYVYGITVDTEDNVYITGTPTTIGIATAGAYQTTFLSGGDAFVAKFNPTGSSLLWGTYYGGGGGEMASIGIAVDTGDNVYITGRTTCSTHIATTGAYQTAYGGDFDAFVAKFNSTGTALLWGTYYGGDNYEEADGIAVDSNDNVYITGATGSRSAIATSGAYQTVYGGDTDAFIAKFNSTGSALLWGTYYGGPDLDGGSHIVLDAADNVYITGVSYSSSGISTPSANQTTYGGGGGDAIIAKFNSTGNALLWGTYYGGSGADQATGIALDVENNVYITGQTQSTTNIATPGAFQTAYGGTLDAFVAKFNPLGSSLFWGTYFGGTGGAQSMAIAIDKCGNSYITGSGGASGIATPGAYQTTYDGYGEAFVAKINTTGSSEIWGTYYGLDSVLYDIGWCINLDTKANVYIAGQTQCKLGIATPGAYLTAYPDSNQCEAFIAKFDSAAPQFTIKPLNTKVCLGKSVDITASGGTSYNWQPPTNLSCTSCPNPIATPTTTITYTVATTSNGCADSARLTIKVVAPPTVTIDTPAFACAGSPILLTSSANGTGPITYQWSPGGQTTDTITVYPVSPTNYTITVSNGCSVTNTVTVTPDNPSMFACCNETITIGKDTTLVASGSDIKNYQWQPTIVCLNPPLCDSVKATPTITTTYTVIGTDTMGCQVERQVTIIVEPPCFNFNVPNVFTPDYPGPNGVNNEFYIKTDGITNWSIIIYDRWGKEMFKTTNPNTYWTGITQNGGNAPDGVYYYILSGNCQGKTYKKDGYLQLIR